MNRMETTLSDVREHIRSLANSGRLGKFEGIEVVEVFASGRAIPPINVLSVVVAAAEGTESDFTIVTPKRIKVDGFPKLTFGVACTRRPFRSLMHALRRFDRTREWALSGKALKVGNLEPQIPSFAPPDSTFEVPINHVLKNNFWAGSHVFRLMDPHKGWLQPFFDDRRRLQSLSDAVSKCVPFALTSVPDFLGDIVIQVPVEAIIPEIRPATSGTEVEVRIHWHPGQSPRPLRAAARTKWDRMLLGTGISKPFENHCTLAINPHEATYEVEVWDEDGTLLAARTTTSTIRTSTVAMHMRQPEPRLFSYKSSAEMTDQKRVPLEIVEDIVVGDKRTNRRTDWERRRQILEETRRLTETREFAQYRPTDGAAEERERALTDIRHLIRQHGRYGVDLWDPYLSANDILQTLFWCPFIGVPLRGLTAERESPGCADTNPASEHSFIQRQHDTLARHAGNQEGLNLEYRTKRGPEGWAFHDRFLIFPGDPGGPVAWSLGTSVNSLGKAHHILQKVPNPALIAGAFEDLWSELSKPEHLIWRST